MSELTKAQQRLLRVLADGRHTLSFHDDWHSNSTRGGSFIVHPHIDGYGVHPRTAEGLIEAGMLRSTGRSQGIEDFEIVPARGRWWVAE